MLLASNQPAKGAAEIFKSGKHISLSTYFPKGTQYFYGYPAGEDSGFFNSVPPDVEELVAARAASCAGENVSILSFAATSAPLIDANLLEEFGIPQLDDPQSILFGEEINSSLKGTERNQAIKNYLIHSTKPGSLVMAQPFTSQEMSSIYQIPASLTAWLNDKSTMDHYLDSKYLPARLGKFNNGQEFVEAAHKFTAPLVAKVSSSSAGDGVYICLEDKDIQNTISSIRNVKTNIIVERYVPTKHNYGLHFGIPQDSTKPIDIIGVNEQLTTEDGSFIGGIIRSTECPEELKAVKQYLLEEALPNVRAMGWYGVGCFDVLSDFAGNTSIIDCNFRMTGMSAFHFLISNGAITAPLISFSGEFTGSLEQIKQRLLPLGSKNNPNRIMQLIALSRHGDTWSFNGAVFFHDNESLTHNVNVLLEAGISSDALDQLAFNS